jgi:hypothetical protein
MPTIAQLPPAQAVNAEDLLPVNQAGVARSATVGAVLAQTQPAIMIDSQSLLGRTSLGAGGPEPIGIGMGLHLNGNTLSADIADFASVTPEAAVNSGDQILVNRGGLTKRLDVSSLRGLFSAGQSISIDQSGVISAIVTDVGGSAAEISELPVAASVTALDLVPISQSGSNYAISYSSLLNGLTIDMAQAATIASDSDTIWVAQGTSTMARQTLGAIWIWAAAKLPTVKRPVVELSVNTTFDATTHNGRILVCSQPITVSAITANMSSGFHCDLINLSNGNITFAAGIQTTSGASALQPGQAATVRCVTYSGGTVVHVAMGGAATVAAVPGSSTGLTTSSVAATMVTLIWSAPTAGGAALAYNVEYRVTGTSTWTMAIQGASATTYQVTGLAPSTTYDFRVTATNPSGSGPASTIVTAATPANVALPGTPANVTASTGSASTISVGWAAPSSGSSVVSYTIQYRISGSTSWSGSVTGITVLSQVITGLTPSTSYDVRVFGTNAAGAGPVSAVVAASTAAQTGAVVAITWNVAPVGSYTRGGGSIGVNAHVNPASAAIQFGFSTSAATPPLSWTAGVLVNSDLWGAYVAMPATAGQWYAWAEGTDGSAPTVYPTAFTVN